MKTGTKVGLGIGCGVLLVLGIAVVVVGYFGLNYVEKHLGESVAKHEVEGQAFGKTTDKQGCMDEGMRRSTSLNLTDLGGGVALGTFVDACLETSRPTDKFCDGVPSFWSMKDGEWAAAECQKARIDPAKTGCIHVAKRKHHFCTMK